MDMAVATVDKLLRSDIRIGPRRIGAVRSRIRRLSLARVDGDVWMLTESGRKEASKLIRAHRLWETYLAGHASIPSSHLHLAAERLEHVTDPEMAKDLRTEVGDASADPHGRPIPIDEDR